jgi:hypothetical protein
MKTSIFLSSIILTGFLFASVNIVAQCTADAGPDKIVCSDLNGVIPIQIGGDPTATGGTPPYTYIWETNKNITIGGTTYTYYASAFLNDTTISNPTIIWGNFDSLIFRVTVHDINSNICIDSVLVRFSFFCFTLEDKRRTIHQGDSVQLYSSVFCGISPLSFHWEPDYNLSDPNTPNPWAKPDTSTSYVNFVTDSAGCQVMDGDAFEVYVIPVSVNRQNKINNFISINPNPLICQSIIQLTCGLKNIELQFFNINGQLEKAIIPDRKQFILSKSDLKSGIFFYRLLQNGIQIANGKLIVE